MVDRHYMRCIHCGIELGRTAGQHARNESCWERSLRQTAAAACREGFALGRETAAVECEAAANDYRRASYREPSPKMGRSGRLPSSLNSGGELGAKWCAERIRALDYPESEEK